eukprot:TRINITY_DN14131_c0_g1_i1.p1 TRINITY_DN14131_c0_g1~~TRINITY_DN14131_c0_g1_i1.p1  ORF type:complete len:340 (-),score=78.55 TRINITY_DN14131_c0_g1_i1:221-1240(-)
MSGREIVKLNVGGKRIETSRTTLKKYPGSTLAKMLYHDNVFPRMQDGSYFLDRDPETFMNILYFLRTEVLPPLLDEKELEELLVESKFFRLEALEHKIEEIKQDEKNSCFFKFSCNGSSYRLEKDLLGPDDVPKSAVISALIRAIGQEIVVGHDEITFSKPETLCIIMNSLRMNVDISDQLSVENPPASYAARLLLFLKETIYTEASKVNVELRAADDAGGSIVETIQREILCDDPDSDVSSYFLCEEPSYPPSRMINEKGELVLRAPPCATLQSLQTVIRNLKFCANAREMPGKRVDNESLLARNLGLLSASNIFVVTPQQQQYANNYLRNFAKRMQQ